MTCLLTQNKFECRVSSVFQKNNRSYGKKHMFDNCPETCWNSDAGYCVKEDFQASIWYSRIIQKPINKLPGTPQWIVVDFEQECNLSYFEIEFQGGFVGKNCHIEIGNEETKCLESFFPEDKNTLQRFKLKETKRAKTFKFLFNESSDLFGRIIIYRLALYS